MLFITKYPKVLLIKNNVNGFLNMGSLYLKAYLFTIFVPLKERKALLVLSTMISIATFLAFDSVLCLPFRKLDSMLIYTVLCIIFCPC